MFRLKKCKQRKKLNKLLMFYLEAEFHYFGNSCSIEKDKEGQAGKKVRVISYKVNMLGTWPSFGFTLGTRFYSSISDHVSVNFSKQ